MTLTNRLSFSTYLFDIEQIQEDLINKFDNLEICLFDECDLKRDIHDYLKYGQNILKTAKPKHVSFHYPMNGSQYWENESGFKDLVKIGNFIQELNIDKLVIHSNYIRKVELIRIDKLPEIRFKIIEKLCKLKILFPTIEICLENMSFLGNELDDADPVFLDGEDFKELSGTELSITFDYCHFWINSFLKKEQLLEPIRHINPHYYEYIHKKSDQLSSYLPVIDKINHIHLSSFRYNNNKIIEGQTLCNGIVSKNQVFQDINFLKDNNSNELIFNLEIGERDYKDRKEIYKMGDDIYKISGEYNRK